MTVSDCEGNCICVQCGTRLPHLKGQPCREITCPGCGKRMLKEGGYHHQLYIKKKGEQNNENSNTH